MRRMLVVGLVVTTVGASVSPARAMAPRGGSEPVASGPQPGDRMVQAGVGVVVAGLVGYGLMAAGLGIGNRAQSDVLPLPERADIEARREVLARGRLGNRLAVAGAVAASVAMAVGIPLIIVGRRRHEAAVRRVTVGVGVGGPGLWTRVRF